MFVGSFHKVPTKLDIDRQVPLSSAPSIILVDEDHKLYEKNIYGLIQEYNITPPIRDDKTYVDHTEEIVDMEERIHDLEVSIKNFSNILGGRIDAI